MQRKLVHYQEMLPRERQLLVGKIVDLMVYDPHFCTQMIRVVELKEELGQIKSKFLADQNSQLQAVETFQ